MASSKSKKAKVRKSKTVRASVSFPRELYDTLERISEEKKVSFAWVVRDAVEQYLAEKWPLFSKKEGEPRT